MSKQKQFRNRLDDLFADMGAEQPEILDESTRLSGWAWECDSNGQYQTCGPEVESILGIKSAEFLGQSLTRFLLTDESSRLLSDSIQQEEAFPLEITLRYASKPGNLVTVRAHIFQQPDNSLRGFSHVIEAAPELDQPIALPLSHPTKAPMVLTPPKPIGTATFGIAIEEDRPISISGPYTGAGKQSLKQLQTISNPSAPGIEAALAVPISMPDRSVGLLEIVDPSPNRDWSEDEQRLVEEVANQLALALENAQLFQETQLSLARTEALFRVGQAAIAFENLVELLQSVVDTIADVLPASRALIAVVDQHTHRVPYFLESHAPQIPDTDTLYDELMNGLTGWAIREQKPAISNVGTVDPRETEISWAIRQQSDAGSVLVVPLIYREAIFGTITAINAFSRPGFNQGDVDLLLAMSNQVATALANNQLFQEVTSRSEELALVNRIVTQITGSLDIEQNLCTVASEISQAFRVQASIGLNNALQTKMEWVAFYSPNPEAPGNIGEESEVWVSTETLILKDVQKDPKLAHMRNFYRQHEIHSLATFPILIGNEILGALEIAMIEPNRDFSDDEIRLVHTILTQASTAIQSARIFQQEQRRRQIAATLSEIARVMGGSLDLEQIAERLLARLSDVVTFNSATLQIIEGDHRRRIGGISKNGADYIQDRSELLRPISEDPLIGKVVESKQSLVLADTHASPLWDQLPETAHVRSWVATPMLRGDEVIGLLILDHTSPNAYDEETTDLLSAIAAQAAVAIHNARLYTQAQDRTRQLQTAAEVSRAASSILDPNPLIIQTVNLIRERFELYYVGLFLIDESGLWTREPGRWAVLRAGTGDAGRIQVERNHKLEVGGASMIGKCIASAQPQISQQVSAEDQRFANPLLPETRSEMALPLISRGAVIGAMTIQSVLPAAFSDEDITILQTMADQVANALQNANLFDQTQARAEELAVLNEMSRQLTATVDVKAITRSIYLFASRLIDTSTFFIALYDEKTDRIEFPLATEDNQEITIESRHKGQGLTEYVLSNREPLMLHENVEGWLQNQGVTLIPLGREKEDQIAQSWLGVPMLVGDLAIGVIGVQHNEPHHYNEQDHDLLVAIASQGAIAFQNAKLFAETRQRTEDLAILNEMSAVLSNQLDIANVVETIYEYIARLMDTRNIYIALYDATRDEVTLPLFIHDGERLVAEPRKLGTGMTDYMLRNRRSLLLNGDILPQMKTLGIEFVALGDNAVPKSFMGAPLIISNQAIGVISLQSIDTPFLYQERQRDLLISIAGQAAIAIQNANLFNESRQRTKDLAILNEMGLALASLLDLETVFRTIYEYTSKLMDTTNFLISLHEPETGEISTPLIFIEHQKIELPTRFIGNGLSDYVIRNRQPLLLNGDVDAQFKALGIDSIPIGKGIPPQSWLGVPMLLGERVIGVICVQSLNTPFLYQERQRDLLASIASQAAITIQTTRLFDQTQKQLADLVNIQQTTSELSAAITLEDITQTLLINLTKAVQADSITMFMLQGNQLFRMGTYPPPESPQSVVGTAISLDDYPLTKQAIEQRRPLALSASDPRLQEHARQAFEAAGISANMTVPLIGPEGPMGTLSLSRKAPGRLFDDQEVRLLETIASQAAISMQNAQLFEQIQQRSEELQLINRIVSQVAASLDLRESLHIIAEEIGRGVQADSVGVTLLNEAKTVLTIMAEYRARESVNSVLGVEIPLMDNTTSQQVVTTKQKVIITDAQNNPLTSSIHDVIRRRGIETLLVLPLVVSGEVIGTVGVDILEKGRSFTTGQINLIETITLQAATAIENARLFEQVEAALNESQILFDASAGLNTAQSFDDILDVLRRHTILGIGSRNISINIFDRPWRDTVKPEWYLPIARWSKDPREKTTASRYPISAWSTAEELLNPNEPTIILDPENDSRLDATARSVYVDHYHAKGLLFAPLVIAQNWIGQVHAIYDQVMEFPPAELRRLMTLIGQATVAIQNIQLLEETRRQLRDLSTISNASQTLSSAPLELRSVAEIIARIFLDVVGSNTTASIILRESAVSDQMLNIVSLTKTGAEITVEENAQRWNFNLREYPTTQSVMETLETLFIHRQDPNVNPAELAFMEAEGVQQLIMIPLAIKQQAIGLLEFAYYDEIRPPTEDELNLVITLANQAAVALENARLYEEQRQTAEQLREIDTLKSQFLANMSHELRTPLNSIIGFSRVIMKGIDGPVTDLQQQDLSAIYNAGQHLLTMINDILDISKIEAGKMELAFDDVDIASIVESVLSTARGLIKDKPVKLVTAVEEDLPIITADPTRVRQILLNLISNASKFTDEGNITITVRKQINENGRKELYLAVTDTGAGIAEEDQNKLFMPFSQVDGSPTRKVGGTGLGLSITRLLVELHGGQIGVISAEGQGSTFWFTLPLPENLESGENPNPMTVLAIDDDSQVIGLYERYLSNAGYQVVALTNPRLALEEVRKVKPFVITLDIMMPDFDGWKLLEELKSDSEIASIPVVICSILAEYDKGKKYGAADYLVKPILEDELVSVLNRLRPPQN